MKMMWRYYSELLDALPPSAPVSVISHMAVFPLSQLRSPPWHTTRHWTPDFICMALVFPWCLVSIPGPYITFSRHVPLAFPGLWLFLKLSISLVTLMVLRRTAEVFCRVSLCLGLPGDFSSCLHGTKDYGSSAPLVTSCQGQLLSTWLLDVDIVPITWCEGGCLSAVCCEVSLFFSFPHCILGKSHCAHPIRKGWTVQPHLLEGK